jgi:prepilin-type N-terminal cleavage/methylation domain-containing protein
MFSMQIAKRTGVSLVEVLIVVAIIAILLQMTLPAIENSREAARRTACQNNLRQIGLSVLQHEHAHSHYPTGGWGWPWMGDSDRGYGAQQPGSWIFNVLEFVENGDVRSMGTGHPGLARSEATVKRCGTPLSIFVCPSRRIARLWPVADPRSALVTNDENKIPITKVARSDYAVNTGDFGTGQLVDLFPKTIAEADDPDFKWYDVSEFTGISYGRSTVRAKDITDGSSKTYLAAEKYVPSNHYKSGLAYGDNECMYSGFDNDNGRSAAYGPWRDNKNEPHEGRERFGSAHPNGLQAVFGDGSVRQIGYDIELDVHKRLANRADGAPVSPDGK